jgi:ABC-type dipeptide/oligopeptide/nickel transport system permease subunit
VTTAELGIALRQEQSRARAASLGVAGLGGLGTLAIVVVLAIAGPYFWNLDAELTSLPNRFLGPSLEHPLGTDDFGRDILARLLHGARLSLAGGALVLCGSTVLGMAIGGVSASIGGKVDLVAARTIDALLSLPSLVVALGIVGVFGKSFDNLVFALVLTSWPWYARIYRGFVVKERNEVYVLAAHTLGCGPLRVAVRHIGPNIAGPALIVATVNLGNAILSLASLSFLGLGVTPPTPEWGAMVSDARFHFQSHPWLMIAPGLAISITVIAVNVAGDALRDAMDPRISRSKRR